MQSDLDIVKEWVYDKCGFDFSNLKHDLENGRYGACAFELDGKDIQYRISAITPIKTGQFVAIWKRNEVGETAPFDVEDAIDFMVITSKKGNDLGQFVFPKSVLKSQGILSQNGKGGKRGIRVYPPWDSATNKQAIKTQKWQTEYFLLLKNEHSTDLDLAKKLFSK